MYIVVDTTQQTSYADKAEAEAALADYEKQFGPGYAIYSPASDKTPLKLELLYDLTLQLLKVGKINPLFIKVEMTNLIGETTEITARQIINDARNWIDATDNSALIDKLSEAADKSLDPMIKAKLHGIVDSLR